QDEAIGQFVVADRPGVDHLRAWLQIPVQPEQLVVDHVAVRDGNRRRGKDRVEYPQRRMHDRIQGRFRRGGSGNRQSGGEKSGGDTAGSSEAQSAPDEARNHRATSLIRYTSSQCPVVIERALRIASRTYCG